MEFGWFGGILLLLVIFVVIKGFVIVHQGHVAVVERLGRFHALLPPGPHVLIPFLDSVVKTFDTRETVRDFEPTAVITKDNATVRINAVTYYRVTDVKAAAYNVQNFTHAMEQLIVTTMRNLIGELELDECLNGRTAINTKLQVILDEATHTWGLKVSRVELKEITPLGDIKDAMDKQMVAERTRRAQILEAEGSKRSAILHAEGAKESAVLRAEGERDVITIRAKAEADALVISSRAQRDAIREVISAFGAGAEEKYLQLKYLETLPAMADGKGTTVFMPTQLGNVASMAAVAGEAFKLAQQPEQAQLPAQVPVARPAPRVS
ncbi:MAG: peptidase [Cyanobacteria bacterium RYN_339]|nr:peptidase [Cyanobacteria bacterium RYN_339]